jgi:predicted lipoprotein with Yx(FWY)xxD motif
VAEDHPSAHYVDRQHAPAQVVHAAFLRRLVAPTRNAATAGFLAVIAADVAALPWITIPALIATVGMLVYTHRLSRRGNSAIENRLCGSGLPPIGSADASTGSRNVLYALAPQKFTPVLSGSLIAARGTS